jgi:hypothetical protein
MAQMLMSDEKEDYFFQTYGGSMLTSPTTGVGLIPLQLYTMGFQADPDYNKFLTRTMLYQMPFGRTMYSLMKIDEKGFSYAINELGIPQKGLEIYDRNANRFDKR